MRHDLQVFLSLALLRFLRSESGSAYGIYKVHNDTSILTAFRNYLNLTYLDDYETLIF